MSGWELGWGLDFLVFMNNLGGRSLDLVLEPFHWLGGQWGYTAFLPILFWSVNDRMGRRLYLLAMLSALTNGILKNVFGRPRPYQVDPARIAPAHVESGYGLPSGHTQGGTVLGLFFASLTRRRWAKIAIGAAVVLMGISRMVIGVHFLQDVLAGWLLGILVFVLFVKIEPAAVRRFKEWPLWALCLAAAVPGLLALATDGIVEAAYPVTKTLLATGGATTGILFGLVLERVGGAYSSDGTVPLRIVRALIGSVLMFGTQMGFSAAFHAAFDGAAPSAVISVVYVLRYAVVGFVGVWLIPEILIRLRLAGPRRREA